MNKQTPGAVADIVRSLRDMIASYRVKPGDRLADEHALAVQHGVSRQTVREALQQMLAEGLIESRRGGGGGIFVAAPDRSRVVELVSRASYLMHALKDFPHEDVLVAMFHLEAACCRLVVDREDPCKFAPMRAALAEADQPQTDIAIAFEATAGLSRALWTASGNNTIVFVMETVIAGVRPLLKHALPQDPWPTHSLIRESYREAFSELERGNATAAIAALEKLLRHYSPKGD